MKREIANRIHWFLESKHKLNKEQTGFRRGRITTDNIVQLETDVKLNFSKTRSTLAVFLDISKAYDSVCSQGLVFKAAKLGITGNTLTCIQEFLSERIMRIQIGNQASEARVVENGVPQGSVLSRDGITRYFPT
jgi:hypothetical protein